jgi:AraC family transcriptional regulator
VKSWSSFPQLDEATDRVRDERFDSAASLILPEKEWHTRPLRDLISSEGESKTTLSRWVQPELVQPVEHSSKGDNSSHVLTLFLGPVSGEWFADEKPFYKGRVFADELWLREPSQSTRAVYQEGFASFRVYLPQNLLTECHEAVHGQPPNTELILSKSKRVGCPTLRRLVQLLANIDSIGAPAAPTFVDGISLAIASSLITLDSRGEPLQSPNRRPTALARWRLNRSIEYIEENLLRPIYLIELSNVAGLSRMHFAAQFRIATGYTPNHYILRRKIAHAQTLLRDPSMSIVNVALLLGFRTQAHFTVVFKSIVGYPPSYWRKHLS